MFEGKVVRVLSYRGAGTIVGGVACALNRLHSLCGGEWWYVENEDLKVLRGSDEATTVKFERSVIAAHYSHCNEFLWPMLHDMPGRAKYSLKNEMLYRFMCSSIAHSVLRQ
jgi:trehalose-6-phosphate synthase